jgi:hypothetical protein
MNSLFFWEVTQRRVVSQGLFGTTYPLHLQGNVGQIRSPETSVVRNQPTLSNIPEDDRIDGRSYSSGAKRRTDLYVVTDKILLLTETMKVEAVMLL